jgi:TRAP-type C4-dicarboxylate transport system permease small subunit
MPIGWTNREVSLFDHPTSRASFGFSEGQSPITKGLKMEFRKAVDFLNLLTRHATRVLLVLGMMMLGAMMFLTATDVILRYLFNRPVSGAYELIEYMMAIVVPFGIAYCAYQRGHVAVDLLVVRFSKRLQAAIGTITSFLTLGLFVLITWQNLRYIREQYDSQLTSAVLLIPVYPFIAIVTVGTAVFCLILLRDTIEFLMKAVTK